MKARHKHARPDSEWIAPRARPIGVFDSGVGGLTVLQALREALPERDFLYVADTARVPYGRKPARMVEGFAHQIAGFLLGLEVEAIVIACNTASAAALPALADAAAVPVWGVIAPGVEAARRATRSGKVGVIATCGTIASRAYQSRLEALGLEVWARACPMFVPLVEEGLADAPETELLARHYLEGHPDIDTLILGCTHYPLLRSAIQRVVGDGVALVSSADAVAELVRRTLPDGAGAAPAGRVVHYVSGDAEAYRHTAAVIGGVQGEIRTLDITTLAVAPPASGRWPEARV